MKSRAAIVVIAIQLSLAFAAPALAQDQSTIDCTRTSTGEIPITDLGVGTYQGEQGGLYPGGSNDIPADHEALGLWRASQIEPRNEAGEPDPNGTVVLLSIGVSNTRIEYGEFMREVRDTVDADITMVNGAQAGEDIVNWQDTDTHPWRYIDRVLGANGVTAEQVQALWIMLPDMVPEGSEILPFPADAQAYRDQLAVVVRDAMDLYPNLQVAYMSSRAYGGYNTSGRPSPEPLAYENGFGVKWLIGDQIAGDMSLNPDARRGPVEAPWLAWGPYLWADGLNARSDGLVWECGDFRSDGTHPSSDGAAKVATLLNDFLTEAPTAAPWFSPLADPIGDVTLPPVVAAATTTTVAETTTTTTVPETTTTGTVSRADRPNQRDQSALEERRAQRIADEARGASDLPWLVGTVAVLALILGAVATFAFVKRRRRSKTSVVTDGIE